jgi:hypothetical protein
MAPKITLKLLVDASTNRVLFAEASKDFDFSLLTLPIGAVAKLISAGTMHGSVGRLYQSVEHMGGSWRATGFVAAFREREPSRGHDGSGERDGEEAGEPNQLRRASCRD